MRKYIFIFILAMFLTAGFCFISSAQDYNKTDTGLNRTKEDIGEKDLSNELIVTWSKTFGGERDDLLRSLIQTNDGGYLLAGETSSHSNGKADIWIIKLDNTGNQLWDRTFGGPDDDWVNVLIQTDDGGYLIAGKTYSFGAGEGDAWIIRLDREGHKIWDRTFGGNSNDSAYLIIQTHDGGYAVGGYTFSSGSGRADFWIIKMDSDGNKAWDHTIGGSGEDSLRSLIQCDDGSYILSGITYSFGAGEGDFWILKLDIE